MIVSPAALLLPLGLALVIAAGLRLALGAERAPKVIGLAVPLAFLVTWGVIVRPGWLAYDSIGRLGHIVAGGMLLGVLLDLLASPRIWAMAAGVIYVLVSVWAEVNGALWPRQFPDAANVLLFIAASAIAVGAMWRIDVLSRNEQPHISSGSATLLLLAMVAFSLAAVGLAAEDVPLRIGACLFAMAIVGFLVVAWGREPAVPRAVLFTVTGGFLGLAWALWERTPQALVGVALTGLILFADGTARRVRLPAAGISRLLYAALLVAISLLPLLLAAAVTYSLRRMP